ncbi:MAG: DUF4112 domain-containing protein [Desulfobacteraceae bacterium]|nr:MAG: DUF4112 domain-containing protein [Desulfobacteraceae bacterium]
MTRHRVGARDKEIRTMRLLARYLDDWVRIPGTGWRIGLDSMIGLVPGLGDVLTMGASVYILRKAYRWGTPPRILGRMIGNVAIDLFAGAVPLLGDLFDAGWKANRKNVDLLLRHLDTAPFDELESRR